ncbi:MAG: sigma 54-interacting transcriptional regulator [Deltaproteobacteria bacterium]|nr:sigma 54-interacting transcriptional regulator [Deltaproteobacteria bacterium]
MSKLLIYRDNALLTECPLVRDQLTIGRRDGNDLVLDDPAVARRHAVLRRSGQRFLLIDESAGVTRVNGQPLARKLLDDRDEIGIGAYRIIYTTDPAALPSGGPAGAPPEEPTRILYYNDEARRVGLERPFLEVVGGPDAGRVLPLTRKEVTVGKGRACELALTDEFVSARHLRITCLEGRYLLQDLDSKNGTFVNGTRVWTAALELGSEVRLGRTTLRFWTRRTEERLDVGSEEAFCGMIGRSPRMREVFALLRRVADSELTVLFLGESGTGKELAARALHALSPRTRRPFLAINMSAITPELFESELFGHEKGAFTNAYSQRRGAFELVDGGTLFLDEIGELAATLQPKFLRALEEREIRRVGGNETIRLACRVIAATNRSLRQEVAAGRFREDLYYRLMIFPIVIPPLREHREDIPLLVQAFLQGEAGRHGPVELAPEAMQALLDYHWPGNVRELKNLLQRALVTRRDRTIRREELTFLPPGGGLTTAMEELGDLSLESAERQVILRALREHRWNKKAASDALGIAKSTLYEKIKRYGLLRDL